MSRAYRVEVQVKGLCVRELEKVMRRFGWMNTWSCEKNEVSYYSGEGSLTGGQSEEEAHKEIWKALKAIAPKALIQTRWTCLEELPYSEYGDDMEFGASASGRRAS